MKTMTIIFWVLVILVNILSIATTCIYAESKNLQWLDSYVAISKKRFKQADTMGYILQLFKLAISTPALLILIVCEGLYNIIFMAQRISRKPARR